MIKPVSETAFEYNGKLVDIVMMKFDRRNCGGANIHKIGNQLCVLAAIADEVWRGFVVDEGEVQSVLDRLCVAIG
jgi:hypothetical protein